jgi:hypothetical protein
VFFVADAEIVKLFLCSHSRLVAHHTNVQFYGFIGQQLKAFVCAIFSSLSTTGNFNENCEAVVVQ